MYILKAQVCVFLETAYNGVASYFTRLGRYPIITTPRHAPPKQVELEVILKSNTSVRQLKSLTILEM